MPRFDPDGPDWLPFVYPRWVAWEYVERNGKRIKMPRSVNGGVGSVSDPRTWGTKEEAKARGGNHIGYVLGNVPDQGEYICGIDLDGCLVDGEVRDEVSREILRRFDTYSEVSPSGRGIHLLFTVQVEDVQSLGLSGRHTIRAGRGGHDEIALDVSGRYYTVTGKIYDGRRTVWRMSREALVWLLGLREHKRYELDNTGNGWACRYLMSWYRKHGDDYDKALRALKTNQGRAGEWARRVDTRQHERAWEVALSLVDNPEIEVKTLEVLRGDQIEPKSVEWVWRNFYALGKIGAIAGPPNKAKSTLMLDLAARVTVGGTWPDGTEAPLGDVVVLTAEDDLEDTVMPRFIAAEGDPARVHFINMTCNAKGERAMFSLNEDLMLLQQMITERPETRMIIIDPVTAYLGINKVDTFRASDLRGVLSPLGDLAKRNRLVVLIVAHFNKNSKMLDALNRISDSVAFGALARHVYCTIDDEDGHLFLPAKNNLVRPEDLCGFRYETKGKTIAGGIRTSRIKWGEKVYQTANEALTEASKHKEGVKLDTAMHILCEMLSKGPLPSDKIKDEAKRRNITERTLERAARTAGVIIQRRQQKPSIWSLK